MGKINFRTPFEDALSTAVMKMISKAVGKRFRGDLFEFGYYNIMLNITVEVNDGVEINPDSEIIEEAVSDSLDDLNQGDDYSVFALDSEIISDKRIAYTVLIRVGAAVFNDWPQGDGLVDHIESFLTDDELTASVKKLTIV